MKLCVDIITGRPTIIRVSQVAPTVKERTSQVGMRANISSCFCFAYCCVLVCYLYMFMWKSCDLTCHVFLQS